MEELNSNADVQRDVNKLKEYWEQDKSLIQQLPAQEKCQAVVAGEVSPENMDIISKEITAKVPVPDNDFQSQTVVPHTSSPVPCKCCPLDVPIAASSTSATVQTVQVAEILANPLFPEKCSDSSGNSSHKRIFEKISEGDEERKCRIQRVAEQGEMDIEFHALKMKHCRELHQVQMKNELDFAESREEERVHRLKNDLELHRLQLQHTQQLHNMQLEHQRAMNVLKIKQAELELKLFEHRMN